MTFTRREFLVSAVLAATTPAFASETSTTDSDRYDVVIVGGGVAGALVAQELVRNGKSVLMLEGGTDSGFTPQGFRFEAYQAFVERYLVDRYKGPSSPYPKNPNADHRTPEYIEQAEPFRFRTNYTRTLGGSTLHWLGTCVRMVPNDFRMKTAYDRGEDWPITYDELESYYERAEAELGVSADVKDQAYLGVWFRNGYQYPMRRIPPSYTDTEFSRGLSGRHVSVQGFRVPVDVISTPQARNSTPNPAFTHPSSGRKGYEPVGALCMGYSSCIPICPIQAKYSALRTIGGIFRDIQAGGSNGRLRLITQAVASRLDIDPLSGNIRGIEYKRYRDPSSPEHTRHTGRGKIYVLAANAIENAKLMLISEERPSRHLGHYLMDHPYMLVLGSAPKNMGTGRGPSSTSGIESLRDGPFRRDFAAFRIEVGNWGWRFATDSPFSDVTDLVDAQGLFGTRLRRALHHTLTRQVHLGPVVEQLPDHANCVTIDRERLDPLGIPRPVIRYDADDYTRTGMAMAVSVCHQVFQRLGMKVVEPEPPPFAVNVTWGTRRLSFYGGGHIIGTHRMGRQPDDSVVDRWQRSWDHRNLFLVGCGGMPTGGAANPTLTMAALALLAADEMVRELNRA